MNEDGVHDVPFPWKMFDDVFSPELVRAAAAEWPLVPPDAWHVYQGQKKATKHRADVPPACSELLHRMASSAVEGVFGCEGLFPDLTLHGAGLHDIATGGKLDVHLDSDHHPTLGWTREISGVLFLNEHWHTSWGGQLQLLDSTGQEVVQCVTPKFNRLVLFRCQENAWHQVSPVTCPPEESRKTLALFWWSRRAIARRRPTAFFRSPAACAAVTPT